MKNTSCILASLLKLLHADAEWIWSNEQQQAFENIKLRIAESMTLAYFDPQFPTALVTDSGPDGLGLLVFTQTSHNGTRRIILCESIFDGS